MSLQFKSAILAGWIHGVFNSQAYGIWRMLLFANTNPILGGVTGIVGIVVLFLLGIVTAQWARRVETGLPKSREVTLMVG